MSVATNKKKITIAYSPDTDDAFMVQALLEGAVTHPAYDFEFISGDIQELNAEATNDSYDITAISVAAYPSIADKYVMVPVGASIGEGYGPAIIVKRDSHIKTIKDLAGKKIAVPGKQTSAFFSSTSVLPDYEPSFMLFSEIEKVVKSGEVDAGILIHELQIECDNEDFRKIDDLGNLWANKYNGLPLPLGANAISRKLGEKTIRDLVEIYRKSIQYAFENKIEFLKKAIDSANPGMTLEMGNKYIDMFVNKRSLNIDEEVKQGIQILYDHAHEHGLCQKMNESEYLFI